MSKYTVELTKERIAFVRRMEHEGMAPSRAEKILRHATTIQRLAVEACNRELRHREVLADLRAQERIRLLCSGVEGFEPVFNGDPRGACVKIKVPSGAYDDWGGTGICVPTPRF